MSSPSDVLDGLFRNLRSRHPEVREQAAVELRDYVAAYTEDHPQDDPIKTLWNDLNQRIFELIHSNQSHEKRGAIVAIGTCFTILHICWKSNSCSWQTGCSTQRTMWLLKNCSKRCTGSTII
jgi:hypothetical protein